MSTTTVEKPKVYKIGFFRQLLQWITFLLLLPFFVSMPIMIGMRAFHGRIFDAAWLTFVAILFGMALIFLGLQIHAARKTRIRISEADVDVAVPQWRGPTPFSPYEQARLPYDQIKSVEQRGEIYRSLGILGLRRVSSVVTNDGQRYVLGYSTENEADAPIPFSNIAKDIAERAGVQLVDKGAVNVGTQVGAAIRGTPDWDAEPIDEETVEQTRKRAQQIFVAMIGVFFLLVIAGIIISVATDFTNIFG